MKVKSRAKPSWPLLLVTVINLITVGFLTGICIILIATVFLVSATGVSPGAFLGAIAFVPMGALSYVVISACVFRQHQRAINAMPILYMLAVAFCFFGVAANIVEAVIAQDGVDWNFIFWIGPIGTAITAYFFLCLVLSIRWRKACKHTSTVSE